MKLSNKASKYISLKAISSQENALPKVRCMSSKAFHATHESQYGSVTLVLPTIMSIAPGIKGALSKRYEGITKNNIDMGSDMLNPVPAIRGVICHDFGSVQEDLPALPPNKIGSVQEDLLALPPGGQSPGRIPPNGKSLPISIHEWPLFPLGEEYIHGSGFIHCIFTKMAPVDSMHTIKENIQVDCEILKEKVKEQNLKETKEEIKEDGARKRSSQCTKGECLCYPLLLKSQKWNGLYVIAALLTIYVEFPQFLDLWGLKSFGKGIWKFICDLPVSEFPFN